MTLPSGKREALCKKIKMKSRALFSWPLLSEIWKMVKKDDHVLRAPPPSQKSDQYDEFYVT